MQCILSHFSHSQTNKVRCPHTTTPPDSLRRYNSPRAPYHLQPTTPHRSPASRRPLARSSIDSSRPLPPRRTCRLVIVCSSPFSCLPRGLCLTSSATPPVSEGALCLSEVGWHFLESAQIRCIVFLTGTSTYKYVYMCVNMRHTSSIGLPR